MLIALSNQLSSQSAVTATDVDDSVRAAGVLTDEIECGRVRLVPAQVFGRPVAVDRIPVLLSTHGLADDNATTLEHMRRRPGNTLGMRGIMRAPLFLGFVCSEVDSLGAEVGHFSPRNCGSFEYVLLPCDFELFESGGHDRGL